MWHNEKSFSTVNFTNISLEAFVLKLRCDNHFTHAFTALRCVFRVEIAKRHRFQPIEKFLLKTQNAAAFNVNQHNKSYSEPWHRQKMFTLEVYGIIFLSVELCRVAFVLQHFCDLTL